MSTYFMKGFSSELLKLAEGTSMLPSQAWAISNRVQAPVGGPVPEDAPRYRPPTPTGPALSKPVAPPPEPKKGKGGGGKSSGPALSNIGEREWQKQHSGQPGSMSAPDFVSAHYGIPKAQMRKSTPDTPIVDESKHTSQFTSLSQWQKLRDKANVPTASAEQISKVPTELQKSVGGFRSPAEMKSRAANAAMDDWAHVGKQMVTPARHIGSAPTTAPTTTTSPTTQPAQSGIGG